MTAHIALYLAQERMDRYRAERDRDARAASVRRTPGLRRRLGESLIRLGERVAATPDPAWSR